MRDIEPKSLEATTYQFQVVCNYSSDIFLIQNSQPNASNTSYDKLNIHIPAVSSPSTSFYINNLRVFLGSDFYFDYSPASNCFIYYNLADIKCLKAKKDFALYQGEVSPSETCFQYGSLFSAVVFNKYTMECMRINSLILGCQIYSEDLTTCLKCTDPNTLSLNNCMTCKIGYFKSTEFDICQACHIKCETCVSYDNCIVCKYSLAIPQDCNCPALFYADPLTFECKNCSSQCEQCEDNSSYCMACTNKNLIAPLCQCDSTIFNLALSTLSTCIPKVCSHQCLTCEIEPSNCLTCASGRVFPPLCDCADKYFQIQNICITCQTHSFFNYKSKQCEQCSVSCKECQNEKNQCTECLEGLVLIDSTCLCQDLSSFFLTSTGEIKCSEMNVSLILKEENFEYYLIFTFEELLNDIDFKINLLDTLIYVYISNISQQSFQMDSSIIDGKTLKIHLKFLESFSASIGSTLFLNNQIFMSNSAQKVLSHKYTSISFSFRIGPLIISKDQWQSNESFSKAFNTIKNQNEDFLSLLKQSSIIFSFLNTLQPCVIFLMLDLVIPPHLYQSLQVIGLLVFPRVPDYSSPAQGQISHKLFSFELGEGASSNKSKLFNKLGYSYSMFANIPLVIISYLLLIFLHFGIFILMCLNLKPTNLIYLVKVKQFILDRINSNLETSLLIISSSIFNQFLNLNQSQFLNRWSFSLAITILILIIGLNKSNFSKINFYERKSSSNNQFKDPLFERYNFQKGIKMIKTFFFIQMMKKYSISLIIVFLESYPSIICASSAFILMISLISTIWIRPYKSHLKNIIKIGGEICMILAWIIFLVKFVPFQAHFKESAIIASQEIEEFVLFGKAVLIILICFNILYLIEFIIFEIILKIWNYLYHKSIIGINQPQKLKRPSINIQKRKK